MTTYTICFHVCVFQAIITLIPAFLLVGIAWNLTLLYSGLFLYSFGMEVCIFTSIIQYTNALFTAIILIKNVLIYLVSIRAVAKNRSTK